MVLVMDMRVVVLQRFMLMFVFVALCKVKPQAYAHKDTRGDELHGNRFIEQNNSQCCANKRR